MSRTKHHRDALSPRRYRLLDWRPRRQVLRALFRFEDDRVIVFPQASIWNSIILHLPGTAPLPPKKIGPDTYQHFTYKPPIGSKQPMKRFRSSSPVTWTEARDRLITAGVIDPSQRGWSLSVAKSDYIDRLAEDLP